MNLPKLSVKRPHTIIVDASGIKVLGEGEWKVKVHGKGRPRKWIKLHLAIDARTQEIVAELTTESNTGEQLKIIGIFQHSRAGAKMDYTIEKREKMFFIGLELRTYTAPR